jgi:hypothetical protein
VTVVAIERKPISAIDVVHFCGSVASITGISLLWLKNTILPGKLLIFLLAYSTATALSLGLISITFVIIRFGYQEFVAESDLPVRFAYLSFAVGIALFFLSILGYLIYGLAFIVVRDPWL